MTENPLDTINDFLSQKHPDTIWVGPSETMLDRLVWLYLESGGEMQVLSELYPMYF